MQEGGVSEGEILALHIGALWRVVSSELVPDGMSIPIFLKSPFRVVQSFFFYRKTLLD